MFNRIGNQHSTLATDLHSAGYRTAMMGKYLNKYLTRDPKAPGWDVWDVADWGYPEFNYTLTRTAASYTTAGLTSTATTTI